jgi:hypothetical protein
MTKYFFANSNFVLATGDEGQEPARPAYPDIVEVVPLAVLRLALPPET